MKTAILLLSTIFVVLGALLPSLAKFAALHWPHRYVPDDLLNDFDRVVYRFGFLHYFLFGFTRFTPASIWCWGASIIILTWTLVLS